jgi:hypothetical protein
LDGPIHVSDEDAGSSTTHKEPRVSARQRKRSRNADM